MVSKTAAASAKEAAADKNGDGKISQAERMEAVEARLAVLEKSNAELRETLATRLGSRGYEV